MALDIKAVISAVDQTGPAFKSAQRGLADFGAQAKQAAGLLAGVFGAISITGIIAGLQNVTEEMDRVGKAAQKVGTTAESLSALEYAAKLSGVEAQVLEKSLAKLARSLDEAKTGSGAAAEAFERLKVDPKQFTDPADALRALAARFATMPDGVAKTALAMDLFGKSGADLIPLLNAGAGGITELEAEARRLGVTFSTDTTRSAEIFNDNVARLQAGLRGMMFDALGPLIPLLAELSNGMSGSATSADGATSSMRKFGEAAKTALQTFIFFGKSAGIAIGHLGQNIGAMLRLLQTRNLAAFRAELQANRDLAEDMRIEAAGMLNPSALPPAARRTAAAPGPVNTKAAAAGKAAASKAATEARQEAVALAKAQEALEKARIEAAAQGLKDSLTTRRETLDQARKQELIDAAGFVAAKAALDEEWLRNELDALQAQREKLQAASTAQGGKASDRTQALADLVQVDASIQSTSDKILNLTQAATSELAVLALAKLRSQNEFITGLEREAALSGLNNEERERALLLLEAEKLGITDINRLLELQAQIRANTNAKDAAKETQRQQDDLYKNVQQGVQSAFADGLNAVASGEGGFAGALKNLVNTIRVALSNALAASLTESFLKSLGGKEGVMSLASLFGKGFADGGYTGAGGKYQPAGVVHAGEFVFSADSVRRLGLSALDNLHSIASGGFAPRAPRWGYADGGLVNLPGAAAPTVNTSTRILNFFDMDSAMSDYLNTRGGERAILNVIQRNPRAVGA